MDVEVLSDAAGDLLEEPIANDGQLIIIQLRFGIRGSGPPASLIYPALHTDSLIDYYNILHASLSLSLSFSFSLSLCLFLSVSVSASASASISVSVSLSLCLPLSLSLNRKS